MPCLVGKTEVPIAGAEVVVGAVVVAVGVDDGHGDDVGVDVIVVSLILAAPRQFPAQHTFSPPRVPRDSII